VKQEIKVTNSSDNRMTLVVEPIGEIYPLAPGENKLLTQYGDEPTANETLEIVQDNDALTIYGALTGFREDSN
jgi:hypothetical protein